MDRRSFLKTSLAGLGGGLLAGCKSSVTGTSDIEGISRVRPNLVYVFSDQQSSDMLGCYGNQGIITPNIDKLATGGVQFNHAVSNCPVCTPYRAMLMSGQHPLYNGCVVNDLRILPGKGKYFAEVLRNNGYTTGYFGKWHLYGGDRKRPVQPGANRCGFDGDFRTNNCTLEFGPNKAFYWDEKGERVKFDRWEPFGQTQQALDFIETNDHKPFAAFVSWHAPHNWRTENGYSAPQKYMDLYDPDKINLRPSCEDTPENRKKYQGYMAMCTSLDDAVGQIVAKLREKHVLDNTIIVYTSDHGDILQSYGINHHKCRPEAISCRVPLIISRPGRIDPYRSDLLIGALDLMPTLLGLMDLPIPNTCQGRNLSDAIVNRKHDVIESVPLFSWFYNWRGIYTRRYTYSFT